MKNVYFILLFSGLVLMTNTTLSQLTGPVGFSLPANRPASAVAAAEFFWDTDPGAGLAVPITFPGGSDISTGQLPISVSGLTNGVHRFYVRTKNSEGVWSQTNVRTFYVVPGSFVLPPAPLAGDIVSAECFFDRDPGSGRGTALSVTQAGEVENFPLETDTLASGIHRLYIRSKNNNGHWSMTNVCNLYIVPPLSALPANSPVDNILAAEYFVDTDPGVGKAATIPLALGSDITKDGYLIPISGLAEGVHHLYLRAQNTKGRWSITNVTSFYIVPVSFSIPASAPAGQISALEYFFDQDPGFGKGHLLPIVPTGDLSDYQFSADISGLKQDTAHTLYVRVLDGWSQTSSVRFALGNTLPVTWLSFSGKKQPDNSVLLEWDVTRQLNIRTFNVERSTDGTVFNSVGDVTADGGAGFSGDAESYSYSDRTAPSGKVYYRIKEQDKDGQISYSNTLSINHMLFASQGFYVLNNPTHDLLRVYCGNEATGGVLQVFDMNGRQLMHVKATAGAIQQLDISNLAAGLYIVRFTQKNKTEAAKFIKR